MHASAAKQRQMDVKHVQFYISCVYTVTAAAATTPDSFEINVTVEFDPFNGNGLDKHRC